jgi:hypothetical protein
MMRPICAPCWPQWSPRSAPHRRAEAGDRQGSRSGRAGAQGTGALIASKTTLNTRRQSLSTLETQQAGRACRFGQRRSRSERALALAEQARDLGGLLDVLDKASALRRNWRVCPGRSSARPAPKAPSRLKKTIPRPRFSAWPIIRCPWRASGSGFGGNGGPWAHRRAASPLPCARALRSWPRGGAGGLCRCLSRLWPDRHCRT